MFELMTDADHVDASPEEVISVHTSINRPMIASGAGGTEPAQGYVCTLSRGKKYFGYIVIHLANSKTAQVFVSDPNDPEAASADQMEASTVQFAEAMGFMMETTRYEEKSPKERAALFETLAPFHPIPEESTIEVVDLEDEGEEMDLEELDGEALEAVDDEDGDAAEILEDLEPIEELDAVEEVKAEEMDAAPETTDAGEDIETAPEEIDEPEEIEALEEIEAEAAEPLEDLEEPPDFAFDDLPLSHQARETEKSPPGRHADETPPPSEQPAAEPESAPEEPAPEEAAADVDIEIEVEPPDVEVNAEEPPDDEEGITTQFDAPDVDDEIEIPELDESEIPEPIDEPPAEAEEPAIEFSAEDEDEPPVEAVPGEPAEETADEPEPALTESVEDEPAPMDAAPEPESEHDVGEAIAGAESALEEAFESEPTPAPEEPSAPVEAAEEFDSTSGQFVVEDETLDGVFGADEEHAAPEPAAPPPPLAPGMRPTYREEFAPLARFLISL